MTVSKPTQRIFQLPSEDENSSMTRQHDEEWCYRFAFPLTGNLHTVHSLQPKSNVLRYDYSLWLTWFPHIKSSEATLSTSLTNSGSGPPRLLLALGWLVKSKKAVLHICASSWIYLSIRGNVREIGVVLKTVSLSICVGICVQPWAFIVATYKGSIPIPPLALPLSPTPLGFYIYPLLLANYFRCLFITFSQPY